MRLIVKAQGGTPTKKPRRVIGHPDLTNNDPEQTYKDLDEEFNEISDGGVRGSRHDDDFSGEATRVRTNSGYIDRTINRHYGTPLEGYADPDTVYTEVQIGTNPDTNLRQKVITRLAGVVHSKYHLPLYGSAWSREGSDAQMPLVVGGKVYYWDSNSGRYFYVDPKTSQRIYSEE